jgi:hypothetical protein
MAMADSDGTVEALAVEVLKEIRDEIRGVRTELLEQIRVRMAGAGVRTAVIDRAARWRIAAMAGTGAVALVALVVALRAGGQPPAVTLAPQVAQATAIPPTPTPPLAARPAATTPAAVPPPHVAIAKPAAAKPAGHLAPGATAVAVLPKKQVSPAVAKLPAAIPSDADETMAFSPPPRRVRVHKMSYDPIESEPAKL